MEAGRLNDWLIYLFISDCDPSTLSEELSPNARKVTEKTAFDKEASFECALGFIGDEDGNKKGKYKCARDG